MAELAIISAVVGAVGSAVEAAGTLAAGREAKKAAEFEAAQLEKEGKQRQASAQIEGEQYKRQKDLALSELQAGTAASGFSATDPTSLALADEITRYGTYQQQLAQHGGKVQRAGLETRARGRRMEGQAALKGSRYSAVGTILGGVSSAAGRYAKSKSSGGGSYRYG